jgi:hypothetical protein
MATTVVGASRLQRGANTRIRGSGKQSSLLRLSNDDGQEKFFKLTHSDYPLRGVILVGTGRLQLELTRVELFAANSTPLYW